MTPTSPTIEYTLADIEKANNEIDNLVNHRSLDISKANFLIFHPFNKPLPKVITIKINKNGD